MQTIILPERPTTTQIQRFLDEQNMDLAQLAMLLNVSVGRAGHYRKHEGALCAYKWDWLKKQFEQ